MYVFWGIFFLAIITVYISVATGIIAQDHFYNSDTLSIPSMYDDFTSGYRLRGWHFGPAPSLFPDLPLYSIVRFFTGNLQWATVAYGCVQLLVYVGALLLVSQSIFGSRPILQACILGGGSICCFLLATGRANGLLPIFLNSFHFGAALFQILCLWVVIRMIRGSHNSYSLVMSAIGLCAIATAMLASDALYLVQFMLPMLTAILLLVLFTHTATPTLCAIYLALTVPIVANPSLRRIILIYRQADKHSHTLSLFSGKIFEQAAATLHAIGQWPQNGWFSGEFFALFQILWLIFGLICLSVVVWLSVRIVSLRWLFPAKVWFIRVMTTILYVTSLMILAVFATNQRLHGLAWGAVMLTGTGLLVCTRLTSRHPRRKIEPVLLLWFVLNFFLLSFAANILSACLVGASLPRYFMPVLLIPPFFGWAFLLGSHTRLMQWLEHPARLSGLAGGVLLIGIATGAGEQWQHFSSLPRLGSYYPDFVRCLDQHTGQLSLRNGMAQYWDAKYLSALSRQNLHIVQVRISPRHGVVPEHFINNLNWYNQDYTFIVTQAAEWEERSLWPDKILTQFGEPATIFTCSDQNGAERQIFVYNRPEDANFQTLFRKYFRFEFSAADLPSETGERLQKSRIARAGVAAPGFLTYGPYARLSVGDYGFEIHYMARTKEAESVGKWDILVHPPKGFAQKSLRKGDFSETGKHVVSGMIRIRTLGTTEIRTYYSGHGILQVDSIRLWRIR